MCSVLQLSGSNTKQKKSAVLLISSVSPRWSKCVCAEGKSVCQGDLFLHVFFLFFQCVVQERMN